MQGFIAYLVGFAVVAGVAVALGITLGFFADIASSLTYTTTTTSVDPSTGQTVTITQTNYYVPQEYMNVIDMAQSLGGTGVTLAIAALIVGLALLLIAVIRQTGGV
ncbi:hypothetical protein ASQ66_gp21 [Aeropyrum pernix spindle-shaped virus 1]|uniref:Uncharacterized protein n=1 Tax=Aeropyrum pernix (strain ATCC 700893 / DSM 11879 / JCM 9820 / NBRC 100138 / K1) TaxID=272557 RepID=Q9YDR7_AERPE|nr:hypothetical protein [Aeropyrum pernix]YP_009177751.1 hypothetical protein ASQ66_gp21 [Aeropyrum pernix spindle-shaped virus 1]BAA79830.1 hypothetical protein APE_0850 [Aeropyrum pernix spindle-shaped virus 1] [Aeropyrum pernix K1]CCD22109.1 TPA: hypothetical protein [Aeropyrum pernix spindle-shaped virus 1]